MINFGNNLPVEYKKTQYQNAYSQLKAPEFVKMSVGDTARVLCPTNDKIIIPESLTVIRAINASKDKNKVLRTTMAFLAIRVWKYMKEDNSKQIVASIFTLFDYVKGMVASDVLNEYGVITVQEKEWRTIAEDEALHAFIDAHKMYLESPYEWLLMGLLGIFIAKRPNDRGDYHEKYIKKRIAAMCAILGILREYVEEIPSRDDFYRYHASVGICFDLRKHVFLSFATMRNQDRGFSKKIGAFVLENLAWADMNYVALIDKYLSRGVQELASLRAINDGDVALLGMYRFLKGLAAGTEPYAKIMMRPDECYPISSQVLRPLGRLARFVACHTEQSMHNYKMEETEPTAYDDAVSKYLNLRTIAGAKAAIHNPNAAASAREIEIFDKAMDAHFQGIIDGTEVAAIRI